MARMARLFIPNAPYHIMARGNQKQTIFYEKEEYEIYLALLRRYKLRCDCLVYGYCIMPNHVHLVAEFPTGKASMSRFMHGLNQSYAMSFHMRHQTVGHLWQNRFKSLVVLKDEYFLNLISYIEYNPLRAGAVSKPEDYPWSSYRARVLGERNINLDPIKL